MKHILMITNDTVFAYNLRREIIERLIKDKYKVTLAAEVQLFQEEFKAIGCNLIDIPTARQGTNLVQDLLLFFRYFRMLKKAKPDIVLTNNIKPNVYAGICCRMLRITYITNVTGLGTPVESPGPLQKLTVRMYKSGVKKARSIFFQNSENMDFFQERNMVSPKSNVVLLPGSGVNLESHPVLPYPEDGQINLLFVARILKEKGIDLYLAAAKRIRKERPDVVFHVCGGCDDQSYEQILKEAQERGDIIYHGAQKDMMPFFAMAHCIVHSSYYPEGMSNVLLESAAVGRPIIATDRSGCRETVDDGVSGYCIPIKDEEALVEAINKILSLPWEARRDMGLAGRAKIEREFDRRIVVEKYMTEIDEVFNGIQG